MDEKEEMMREDNLSAEEEAAAVQKPQLSEEMQKHLEEEADKVGREQTLFRDANGDFNWGLLAVILLAAMLIVGFVWVAWKVVKFFGSALFIVLAVAVIVYTIFHIRE